MSKKRRVSLAQGSIKTSQLTGTSKIKDGGKNWNKPCENCGELPTVHPTGLCGVCCFGEADCAGGNW
ncbi:hypothetical protein MIF8_16 [Erwinia phage MIF8]